MLLLFATSGKMSVHSSTARPDFVIRYLVYGEEKWRQQATDALKQMDCFNDQTTKEFNETLAWLHEHAVSGWVVWHIAW